MDNNKNLTLVAQWATRVNFLLLTIDHLLLLMLWSLYAPIAPSQNQKTLTTLGQLLYVFFLTLKILQILLTPTPVWDWYMTLILFPFNQYFWCFTNAVSPNFSDIFNLLTEQLAFNWGCDVHTALALSDDFKLNKGRWTNLNFKLSKGKWTNLNLKWTKASEQI